MVESPSNTPRDELEDLKRRVAALEGRQPPPGPPSTAPSVAPPPLRPKWTRRRKLGLALGAVIFVALLVSLAVYEEVSQITVTTCTEYESVTSAPPQVHFETGSLGCYRLTPSTQPVGSVVSLGTEIGYSVGTAGGWLNLTSVNASAPFRCTGIVTWRGATTLPWDQWWDYTDGIQKFYIQVNLTAGSTGGSYNPSVTLWFTGQA